MIKSSKHNKLLFIKAATSLVALGFAFTTNVLAMQTYEDSSEDIVKGSPLSPKQKLKQDAKKGDAQAQHDLGMLYLIILKKPKKGIAWLQRAAALDHANAQIEVERMYLDLGKDEISQDADADKAMQNITKAVETNNVKAQFNFGVMFETGKGVDQDEKEAFKWYRLAAEQGLAAAQCNLGYAYDNGKGVDKDDQEAFKWYCLAAEQGLTEAQFNLGYAYENGKGVDKDRKKAVKFYHLAAEQGLAAAQCNLGLSYLGGTGVKESGKKGEHWLRLAAEQGNSNAQYALGIIYTNGFVVRGSIFKSYEIKPNKVEANKWFEKAAAQGHPKAAALLPSQPTSET